MHDDEQRSPEPGRPTDRRGTRRRAAGIAIGAASFLLATVPAGASEHQTLHGTFTETGPGGGLGYDISGAAKLTAGADRTTVKANIAGLDPSKRYGSHLHDGTCASGGGGHYQDVVDPTRVTPPNELWLSSSSDPRGSLAPNPGGVAHGSGSASWAARLTSTRTNARSIVVHEPGVAGLAGRIACADLT